VDTDRMPFEIDAPIEPVYTEFRGWKQPITKARAEADLPDELVGYVKFIEQSVGVPVTIISVGPERDATVFRTR
jgi:adenylosuccinate synthase